MIDPSSQIAVGLFSLTSEPVTQTNKQEVDVKEPELSTPAHGQRFHGNNKAWISRHPTDFRFTSYFGNFAVALPTKPGHDSYFWIFQTIPKAGNQDIDFKILERFIDFTEKNRSLFAKHVSIQAQANHFHSEKSRVVEVDLFCFGCAKNQLDLEGYLSFSPDIVTPCFRKYLAHQALRILNALECSNFTMIDESLLDNLQVWRQNPDKFEVRLGSFSRYKFSLPKKSTRSFEVRQVILKSFISQIKKFTTHEVSDEEEAFYNLLLTNQDEKQAENWAKYYDMQKVNNQFQILHGYVTHRWLSPTTMRIDGLPLDIERV